MPYRVTVERNTLRFAAAHMATFEASCEPLHGHNYDVSVEVEGELTDDAWVIDFSVLKAMTRELCQELDHKFLLQSNSNVLEIAEEPAKWKIRFGDRGFVFPRADVIALPIDNTTAERLAEWFARRLLDALAERDARNVTSVSVTIEEMPGQSGSWRGEA
jgi:6-pyruvoyltetrahydropterin/6-carboxytetrahydropterin synthase